MKNRLQKAFSHDMPTHLRGTIKFADNNYYREFIKTFQSMHETGEVQKVEGVENIIMNQVIQGTEYPLSEHCGITEMYISPSVKKTEIPVNTEFGEYIWDFYRTQSKNKIQIKNTTNDIVHIIIEFDLENENVNFSYKTSPTVAQSITKIVETYNAALELFSYLFKKAMEEFPQYFEHLRKSITFYMRIIEIEKCFGIAFCPQNITNEPLDQDKVAELYLSIVKGNIIRENRGIDNFSMDCCDEIPDNVKAGTMLSVCFLSDFDVEVYGVILTVHTVNVVINVLVDSVEEDVIDNKYIIKTRDTDISPMYISYKGFTTEKCQKYEMDKLTSDYNEKVKRYSDAKTLNQQLKIL